MADDDFDPSLYIRAPVFNLAAGISLTRALLDDSPKALGPVVKKARKHLEDTLTASQKSLADRQREENALSGEDPREIDQEADTLWSALRTRLVAYGALPDKRVPRAVRAREIVAILFGGEGLSFLKARYVEQWSTMDAILSRIAEDKLQKDIDTLAGPEFLEQIQQVHVRYGAMVKESLTREEGSAQNLREQVQALQKAIVAYATKVCATVEEDEPETRVMARLALRALDHFRLAAAKGRGGEGEEAAGDAAGATGVGGSVGADPTTKP